MADPDIYRSAGLWLELHGDEAVPRARAMASDMRASGDADSADIWREIIVAVEELRRARDLRPRC